MRAKQVIDSATYGPEALKIVFEAFDNAWASIAGNFGDDPEVIETARLKLARAILSFPEVQIKSAEQTKNSALQIMALQHRSQS